MNLERWFERLAPAARPEQNAAAGLGESPAEISGQPSMPPSSSTTGAAAGTSSESAVDTFLLSIARPAMACEFEMLLNQHQYPQAADRAVEALDLVQQLENLHSVYKPRSELSILNRFGALRGVPISADTLTLLELAKDLHQLTGGAFDITAGSLSEAWGFSRRQGALPSQVQLAEALSKVGSQYLQIDATACTASLARAGVQVNPGGIGKGYALDRAAQRMRAAGIEDFMMHGGRSSVVAHGDRLHAATGGGWLVSLKHPWRWEETLGTIRLRNAALGTSGSGKQFFHFGGKRYSHIIDPRSGWPAQGMLSVTVICPSGAVADALATAMFVLGAEPSRRFCAEHPSIAAILIHAEGGKPQIEACNVTDDMWQLNTAARLGG